MIHFPDIKEKIVAAVESAGDSRVLIIVPPFGSIEDISLGPHILQSIAQKNGYKTHILYLNLLLASIIGADKCNTIIKAPNYAMIGERLFTRSAYGLPPLGHHPEYSADGPMSTRGHTGHPEIIGEPPFDFDLDQYMEIERACFEFAEAVTSVIAEMDYDIVGCTAMMEQINGTVALLNGIKKKSPGKLTLMGGGHCQVDMSDGTATLSPYIDYIFSGESEVTFIQFLNDYYNRTLAPRPEFHKGLQPEIIRGKPFQELDTNPVPDYRFFFHQYRVFFGHDAPDKIKIWYETSRGCWWSDILKCQYCGILHHKFRQKSIPAVLEDLKHIGDACPGKTVYMIDSAMPTSHNDELLPFLVEDGSYPPLGFQIKANLDLKKVAQMKKAKIDSILPGIESFSTGLLNHMHKGITGKQNVLFLRNARSAGIFCDYLLLSQLPGDNIEHYKEMLEILPLIHHLQPPRRMCHMLLMRFSPYFKEKEKYNITNVRPWAVMDMIYPDWADKEKLTTYFSGEYPCGSHEQPEIIVEFNRQVELWKEKWTKTSLVMKPFMDKFMVFDNRDIHENNKTFILDKEQASEIMTARLYEDTPYIQWAIKEKLGIHMDSWYVPLTIAPIELLLEFEEMTKAKLGRDTVGNENRN